jgi:TetR/AcrR family transcriptional regulator
MKRAIGRKRRQNEAKILAAAEKVFAERGFAAATTSAIAKLAGMPKANLHYYFRTKQALYTRVLDEILALWIETAEAIRPEADPKKALSDYIAAKIDFSRSRPQASKVFANEILHGAPRVRRRLKGDLKTWLEAKSAVIEGWIAAGRMAKVEPKHLFFIIWASTQTYADFEVQVTALLDRRRLKPSDFETASALLRRMVLSTCGLGDAVSSSLAAPPSLTLLRKGGGDSSELDLSSPAPSTGAGRGGGDGSMSNAVKRRR